MIFIFILSSQEEKIFNSFFYYFRKYDYSLLLKILELDPDSFTDFEPIKEVILDNLKKKKAFLTDETDIDIKIVFNINEMDRQITLLKFEMDNNDKFELVVKELNSVRRIEEDKINEIKKESKAFEEDTGKKCEEQKKILDEMEVQVNKNTQDIENQTKELEELKAEIERMKKEIKENENNPQNNNGNDGCLVF